MPLIRRDPPEPPRQATPPPALDDPDPDRRRAAAQAVADPGALAAALAAEPEPRVREALLAAFLRLGQAAPLLPFLRAEDAGLRAGAIGVLQALPHAVLPHLSGLLADPDPDVRVLAAEIARGLPGAEATALLVPRLAEEEHPNACGALVEVLAERGTPEAIPALRALAARMARDPFLPFAAAAAIARLGGRG